jgi:predicted Zn-dependent protease
MSSADYGYGPAPSGRPINLRLVAALLIAVFAIAAYFFDTQTNPVTGKKQRVAMDVNQEMRLGLQSAPKMAAEMGGAADPNEDPRARLVAEVGSRIVHDSDAHRSPYVGNYHFYLLNDPETINAFALPGGQVFITRGLFDKLRDEAELAGVLGHEIGHVVNRHSAEHMASGRLGQLLTMAVGVGASGNDDRGRNAQLVAAMVNQMTQLKFSRQDESEADVYGLRYMAQSGYDPKAMLDVMKVLKAASGGSRQPEFLATHPLPETRLEEIQHTLDQVYPDGIPKSLTRGRQLGAGASQDRRNVDSY